MNKTEKEKLKLVIEELQIFTKYTQTVANFLEMHNRIQEYENTLKNIGERLAQYGVVDIIPEAYHKVKTQFNKVFSKFSKND